MITQEMKDKSIHCKGKGFNYYSCKDTNKCVEYEIKPFLEPGKIYYVQTQFGQMYVGALLSKEEDFFIIISGGIDGFKTPILYESVKEIHVVRDIMEFKMPNIILSKKNDEMPQVKPPIGIMPKKIWDLQRMNNLKEAIERYCNANKEVPFEWIDEYNLLVKQYKLIH